MLTPKVNEDVVIQAVDLTQPGKKELWAYGMGSLGLFSIWTLIGSFLTYYYTDIVGIAAGVVGTMMLIARLFDGVTDIGMGVLVDRTKSKHGKARPWLLWMAIPLCVSAVLLYAVPDTSMTGKIVYAYITYLLFILVYTAVSIPYKTLLGMMTQHQHSRSLSNIYSSILNLSGILIVTALTQPIAARIGWAPIATIYGVVAIIAIYVTFRGVKERVAVAEDQDVKPTVGVGTRALFKNKYWVIITLFCVTFYVLLALVQGAGLYYASWVLGNVDLFPLIGLALIGPIVIALFFISPLVARIGKRNAVMIGAVVLIVGQLVRLIDPTNLTTFLVGTVITGLGAMPTLALVFAMINDTVEYGEYKTGVRTFGLINSGASFGMKVGTGVGLALIGWLLALGGYDSEASAQSALSIKMIVTLNVYLPMALAVVMILLLVFFRLDKEYPRILAEIQSRKSASP